MANLCIAKQCVKCHEEFETITPMVVVWKKLL